jgi:5'-nucleotidase
MRILISNDDGILAPGLAALREAVLDLGEVIVVAPDAPQSATGRAITLGGPMVCQKVHVEDAFWGYSLGGKPTDCVKVAVDELTDGMPDLILSGINAGSNVGVNVFYSGTVAAAAEGALYGMAAVSFSLAGGGGDPMDFKRAARICRQLLDRFLDEGLAGGQLLNVNIPTLGGGPPKGVKVVPQSTAAISEEYIRSETTDGKLLFQLSDYYEHGPAAGETDVSALEAHYITVTPLHADLTDHSLLARFRRAEWPDPGA